MTEGTLEMTEGTLEMTEGTLEMTEGTLEMTEGTRLFGIRHSLARAVPMLAALVLAALPAPVAAQQPEAPPPAAEAAPAEEVAPVEGAAPSEEAAPEEQMAPEEIDATIEEAAAVDIEAGLEDLPERDEPDNSWGFLLAGKFGGMVPFSDLGVMATGALELGVVFGGTKQRIAALLDISYTVPTADGKGEDSRMQASGMENDIYSWELTQKELSFQPTFVFRFTGLLEPLGCEFELGPGGLLAELLFQWGPLTHDITGDSNLGSASLWLGYRAIL
jgi:hypothetical protein